MGAAETGAGATECDCHDPDTDDLVAQRVRGIVAFADRAQDQSGTGSFQRPGNRENQSDAEIDQRVMGKQDRPDKPAFLTAPEGPVWARPVV